MMERTWMKLTAIGLITTLLTQATLAGAWAGWVSIKEVLQQKRYPGVFTSAPGPINFGANPSRDAVYRGGFFTEKTLRDRNRIDPPEPANLDLSADPLSFIGIGINLPALVQGGGGGGGGGTMGGEGYQNGGPQIGGAKGQGSSGGGGSS